MNRFLILISCILICPSISYATLGESSSSIQRDNQTLASQVSQVTIQKKNANPNFTTSVIQTKNGIIKEFSAQDKVFAVSWTGTAYPDFKQIFGEYFPQLKNIKQTPNDMAHTNLIGNDFIMQMSGSLHQLSGIAYIPSLIPANVTIAELN